MSDVPITVGGTYEEQQAYLAARAQLREQQRIRRERVETLRGDVRTALEWNADYLALSPPNQADVVQQVRRLTQECDGIIRLLGSLVVELADLLDDPEE